MTHVVGIVTACSFTINHTLHTWRLSNTLKPMTHTPWPTLLALSLHAPSQSITFYMLKDCSNALKVYLEVTLNNASDYRTNRLTGYCPTRFLCRRAVCLGLASRAVPEFGSGSGRNLAFLQIRLRSDFPKANLAQPYLLPDNIHLCTSPDTSKWHLKTHLFNLP